MGSMCVTIYFVMCTGRLGGKNIYFLKTYPALHVVMEGTGLWYLINLTESTRVQEGKASTAFAKQTVYLRDSPLFRTLKGRNYQKNVGDESRTFDYIELRIYVRPEYAGMFLPRINYVWFFTLE